jgi:regulatory protein YycI of two-component signal transduction system YycFG
MKTLAIVFLCYVLFRFIFKILAPILLSIFIKKSSQRFEQNFNQKQSNQREEEGNISIDKNISSASNKKSDNVGDYVDFEEIND